MIIYINGDIYYENVNYIRINNTNVIYINTIINISKRWNFDSKTPDVTVFAAKEQMMDDTFTQDSTTKEPKNIGKIVFGKSDECTPIEWYALGQDDGIKDSNEETIDKTTIFSLIPLKKDVVFNSTLDSKGYYF